MYRWTALIAAVVCVVAFAGVVVSSRSPTEPNQLHSAENKAEHNDKKGEKTLWDTWFPDSISVYTLFLVVFTALLAFVGFIQLNALDRAERIATATAQAAKDSADVAKQTLIVSSRPWLTMEPVFASDLTISPMGVMKVSVALKLKNVGKSPANSLIVVARLIPEYSDAANATERLIAEMTSKKGDGEWPTNTRFGRSLFPDEIYTATKNAQLEKNQVGQSYRGVLGIAAVAAYVSEVTGGRHYTFFFAGFDLPADSGQKILTFSEGTIPRESLRLGTSDYGQRDEYPTHP
jgi:hypothetical protein